MQNKLKTRNIYSGIKRVRVACLYFLEKLIRISGQPEQIDRSLGKRKEKKAPARSLGCDQIEFCDSPEGAVRKKTDRVTSGKFVSTLPSSASPWLSAKTTRPRAPADTTIPPPVFSSPAHPKNLPPIHGGESQAVEETITTPQVRE